MKTFTGYELSQDKPLSYQMIAQWIRRVGEILGLEYPTIPYNLRYNAANEFDRSADISESLRNLALDEGKARQPRLAQRGLSERKLAMATGESRGEERVGDRR
ncbi:hypothetical protein HRG_014766 [Hirsutella rhossiliensis]